MACSIALHQVRPLGRLTLAAAIAGSLSACTIGVVDTIPLGGDGVADSDSDGDSETNAEADGYDEGFDAGESGEAGGDENGLPLFDIGGGQAHVSSCEFAAQFPSHVGCEFYAIDVDQAGLFDFDPYGFVVVNPRTEPVHVELSRDAAGIWEPIESVEIAGQDEFVFLPADNQAHGTGLFPGAVFRLSSDHPVVVIQASPAVGEGHSSSASLLHPAAAWTAHTRVAGWRTHEGVGERSFLGVVARSSGTPVSVGLSFELNPGVGVEWDEDPVQFELGPGALGRLDAMATAAEIDHGISGTTVNSGQEHPIAVFSAHTCAAIPDYVGSCGHMQEQLGARLVGQRFVAPRLVAMPDPNVPGGVLHERTMVQVVATEPDTDVTVFQSDSGVLETVTIDPLDPYAVYQSDGELAIVADKPVVASVYMTNAQLTHLGSPSMVQLAPVEQWASHHWVWVPDGFDSHLLVTSTNAQSVEVRQISTLDGSPPTPGVAAALEVTPVDADEAGSWEVARIPVEPGVHRVESAGRATVVVAGWRTGDGFAYLGGWGESLAGLDPAG